jgi:hypothetical protein
MFSPAPVSPVGNSFGRKYEALDFPEKNVWRLVFGKVET